MPCTCFGEREGGSGSPYDRPREPWSGAAYTGPVLVLRALLHSYELFAIPGGIDEARAIVNDLDDPLIERPRTPHLGEVYIERLEPGDGADEVAIPSGYEQHGVLGVAGLPPDGAAGTAAAGDYAATCRSTILR